MRRLARLLRAGNDHSAIGKSRWTCYVRVILMKYVLVLSLNMLALIVCVGARARVCVWVRVCARMRECMPWMH